SGAGAYIYSQLDEKGKQGGVLLCKVLACKNNHRIIKHEHIINAAFLCALAFVMDNACVRKIIVLIAGFCNTVAYIYIFSIHEIILIQQAGFVKGGFSKQHKCA